jgi:predicted LPLAT superfamily acyltransferase
MSPPVGWLDAREKGGVLGIRFVVWLCTAFGRAAARAVIAFVAIYYVAFGGQSRRASRAFLTRIGAPARLRDIYQHILRFSHCTVDRFFFLRSRFDHFVIDSHGTELLREAQAAKRGAILLGAHLGSFEAMRMSAQRRDYPINIVGSSRNAKMINAALRHLNPEAQARVVEIDPDNVDFVLALREMIDRGEFVAILGDRALPGARTTVVDFLGGRARLPIGPYLLAALLRCPVFLTFGLYREPNRYDLHCELFADRVLLDRRDRETALAAYAARYAQRLEHYARTAPDNWFNFYDFWESP